MSSRGELVLFLFFPGSIGHKSYFGFWFLGCEKEIPLLET
jgi:hypothetical protein